MKNFNGKKEAEKTLKELKKKIKKEKLRPRLAIFLVGENPNSKLYIKLKKRAASEINIKVAEYKFKENTKAGDIIKKIASLNKDRETSGILVQLPLPKRFNADKIIKTISLKKDVDGFQKNSYFPPVLPQAILIALKEATKNFKNKKNIALVNSNIFGKELKQFLRKERININYYLNKNKVKSKLKSADVIITASGFPGLIRGDSIKKGVILIDAGITRYFNGKVAGDVDKKSVEKKAAFLTPVPGGIGPLTVALLLKNVYNAARYKVQRNS